MPHIDLNLLRVFDILLTERSVTRTAHRLSLTQSSVSGALHRLRTAVNDQLFVRGEGGIIPTSAALALGGPIRDALNRIDKALNDCATFTPAKSQDTVRLRAEDSTLAVILPRLLQILAAEAPLLRLEISSAGHGPSFDNLRTGELDLLIMTTAGSMPESLRATKLYSEALFAVTRSPRALSLTEFVAAKHIVCSSVHAADISAGLDREGLCCSAPVVVESHLLGALLMRSTDSICVLPERAATGVAEELRMFASPLPIRTPARATTMVWHERVHHNALHRWLRAQVSSIRAGRSAVHGGAAAAAQKVLESGVGR